MTLLFPAFLAVTAVVCELELHLFSLIMMACYFVTVITQVVIVACVAMEAGSHFCFTDVADEDKKRIHRGIGGGFSGVSCLSGGVGVTGVRSDRGGSRLR